MNQKRNLTNECDNLDPFLLGELNVVQSESFESHLEQCAICQRQLEAQVAIDNFVQITNDAVNESIHTNNQLVEKRLVEKLNHPGRYAPILAVAVLIAIFVSGLAYQLFDSDNVTANSGTANNITTIDMIQGTNSTDDSQAFAPKQVPVTIEVDSNSKFMAVPMPTANSEITIMWLYPTVESLESKSDRPDEQSLMAPAKKIKLL